jgi:hypothetical protein
VLTFEDTAGFDGAAAASSVSLGALGFAVGALAGNALFGAAGTPGAGPLAGGLSAAAAQLAERVAPWAGLACAAGAAAIGQRRRARAAEAGEPAPSRAWLLAPAMLAAIGGLFAARALPALASLLVDLLGAAPIAGLLPLALRAALSCAACGAALGLWLAACAVPLHLARRTSAVDRRLGELRFLLGPELRPIAERAAQAHRGALAELRGRGAAGALPIRTTLDQHALVSLDLAARVAELARAAPPAWQEQALRRRDDLVRLAGSAQDPLARASFERAAAAQEQLASRSRELAAGRERLLARLHEEVAELERARAALALLAGAAAEQAAAGIDLLDERLRAGAATAEAIAATTAPMVELPDERPCGDPPRHGDAPSRIPVIAGAAEPARTR